MNDMIFEGNYPQDGDVVILKEPFRIGLNNCGPKDTIIRKVIKKGFEGKVIRNFGWYLSIAFEGYEIDIYTTETYDTYIEWLDDIL